jgi:hypothetical protein
MRLYLAVFDDITPEQRESVYTHMARCAACREESRVLVQATRLVGSAAATTPSPRVDAVIRAMAEGRSAGQQLERAPRVIPTFPGRAALTPRRISLAGGLVMAAVIVLALFASLHISSIFDGSGSQTAFAIPASLSWNQYVLYHSETRTSGSGEQYQVESYNELATGNMHVETKMDGEMDVVAVTDTSKTIGIDMIHHVAQMNATRWMVDDSMFDLNALRHDLQTKNDVYLDTETYKGQEVYRIRSANGQILLLDMQYRPVNVLDSTGKSIYTSLKLIPDSQVSPSMWDMSIPKGYRMGSLPAMP